MFASSNFSSSMGMTPTQPVVELGATANAVGKKPRKEEPNTCLPITIRGISHAVEQRGETGELRFYGTEPGVLLVVALVEAMTKQATSTEFSLSDGTGRIKARHYVNQHTARDLAALAPGRYVSVFGSVRTAPEVHFAVGGMSLVDSADEVSYHMIEAAHAALKLQKGRPEPVTPAPKKVMAAEADLSPQKMETMPSISEEVHAVPKEQPLSGSALKKAVLKVIKEEGQGHVEGVSLSAVCSHLSSTPAADISVTVQKLVDAAEIYTTIDDDHFQLLE